MSPPTTPYVTPNLAAILMQNLFGGQAPSDNTAVQSDVLKQLIEWTDAIVNGLYRSVGYKVPFATLAGETWPAHQTSILQIMSAIGSASMASGQILLPAPRMVPGREGGERSVWAVMFDQLREQVLESGLGFRAQYWLGTKAMGFCNEPYGPRTEFYDGYYDPARHELLHDYTDRMKAVFTDVQDMDIDWNYLYDLTLSSSD